MPLAYPTELKINILYRVKTEKTTAWSEVNPKKLDIKEGSSFGLVNIYWTLS
ncbi:hypothetical protein [Priestia endophytica]|uniref:hypothetical protein n=1 Tax=Priestia endophytica TaxID=135735 RepID=UPI003D272D90